MPKFPINTGKIRVIIDYYGQKIPQIYNFTHENVLFRTNYNKNIKNYTKSFGKTEFMP